MGEVGQFGEVVHVGGLHVLEAEQRLWEKEGKDVNAVQVVLVVLGSNYLVDRRLKRFWFRNR